jgi:hypothetical protein
MNWSTTRLTVLVLCLAFLAGGALAERSMLGRQSQNEGMLVVPTPGKVTIDGKLTDWDWSGRIWVFADSAVRSRYSVEAAAMWDKDHLYLGARWKDPTPLNSTINPEFNVNEGWKADAWQVRVRTGDLISHATMWYYSTKGMPVFHIQFGKSDTVPFGGEGTFWVGKEKGTVLGRGIELAYLPTPEGDGFTQEVKIPWSILWKSVPELKAGMKIQLGHEFLWADPTGNTWPVHRYADNLQAGSTSREFFWTNWKGWGDAMLQAKGTVPVRTYIDESTKLVGTIPVRVTIPKDAARFTVVIEDQTGARVRNLAGDGDPEDYTVKGKGTGRTVEVPWDGLDDKGRLVPPGTYRVRGLTHKGLGAEYEMCFYNPGTPPWPTKGGAGAWGADHSPPNGVATGGDWTLVTWAVAEGGSGIIGLDAAGRKRWSDKRGTTRVTADARYAYAFVEHWYVKNILCRYRLADGAMVPFEVDGQPRVFDLPLAEILGETEPGHVTGMAVHGESLVLALSTNRLAILNAATAQPIRLVPLAGKPGGVAFGPDGAFYALLEGAIARIDLTTGASTPFATPGVGAFGAFTTDRDGNLLVADLGTDSQVKAFSPQGKVVYTCGKKGGRPLRGTYEADGLRAITSVAVDAVGEIWIVEGTNFPRRVSVWREDGKLVRDYLGNTGYAGTGSFLHDTDPSLAYVGPLEFKLDKTTRSWSLARILWTPDWAKGESFYVDPGNHAHAQRFTSQASGKPREYLYSHDHDEQVVYMDRGGRWQPVAALCTVGAILGKNELATSEFAGLNPFDTAIWNDDNRDAKVQRKECTIILTPSPSGGKGGGRSALAIGDGWGGRVGDDLSIYTNGLIRYRPQRFTDDGAPIYGLDGRFPLGVGDSGDLVPVPGEDRLLCMSNVGYAGPTKITGIDLKTNKVQWFYPNPYPGVHGSHRATMPKPGLLIGPLKIMGTARISDDVGSVFAMRGNLGQDFFLTTDGLYVGALFQDCRLPGESLPDKEEQLVGRPLEAFSEGGEPFNGWFGKQTDGVVRMTTGLPRQAAMIMQIKGLETIHRFDGGTLTVDVPALVKAEADNATRAAQASVAKRYTIGKVATPPVIDGEAKEWAKLPALPIAREGQPDKGTAKLTYDATNLYVLFEVADSSPWRNEGKDFGQLFKTGDAVDLQLGTKSGTKAGRNPQAGDLRLVLSQLAGKPAAILMAPVDPAAPAGTKKSYTSPVGTRLFDRVEILAGAQMQVKVLADRYVVEAAIPLTLLGLAPQAGYVLRGDAGFISSDGQGMINVARTYWSNRMTNLVNDLPLEAWFTPEAWGELVFE